MITNRYFILPYPNANAELWDIVVSNAQTVRANNLGNKCVVKLYVGDTQDHQLLNGFKEYDHAGILVELEKAEWNSEI